MKHLYRSAAIVVAASAFTFPGTFSANAQDSGEAQQTASSQSYCERQWSEIDGNADGFVSEAEATAALERRFDEIDADGNGDITKTEYLDCRFQDGQTSASVERDTESFEQADANQDDGIGQDEFRDMARQAYDESRSAASLDDEAYVILRRFVWLTPEDADDDSLMQGMSEDEAAARSFKTFSALDQNDDGIVDTEEWAEEQPVAGVTEEQADIEFSELDENASSSIGRDEYRDLRMSALDEMTTASTPQADTAADSDEPDAGAEATGSSAGAGTPIYIYRFW